MLDIQKIEDKGNLLALIIKGDVDEGVNFVTPDELPLQLGFHNQKKGTILPAHKHKPLINIEKLDIAEIFYIKEGEVKISIFNKDKLKIAEVIAVSGDVIYLFSGHGFEFLNNTKMFEIKQGPYRINEEKEMI
jgi:hypothetical protein